MKKIFLSTLLIASTGLYSQELDEAYLESLPDSVRDDVLEKMTDREELDKPVYRRPSTMVDKVVPSGEDKDKAIRFGEIFFNKMQSSFMPINEPNLDGSYVLDFGDTLEIQLIGQKNSIEKLSIKRDGSINIPEIGKISVAGLSLDEVSSLIKAKIANAYIGIEAFVTLVNIRDIQVLLSGSAYNPGIYTLNGNSSVLHAISMAGGIDSFGSYRNISLIRDGEIIDTIDLYDVFIFGKSNFGSRLRSGDSINIHPAGPIIQALSGVKRPSYYELKEGENYSHLIKFANGLLSNVNTGFISIQRMLNGEISLLEVSLPELLSMKAKDLDSLLIQVHQFGSISIEGAVNLPGVYKITEGTSLKEIIKIAGGYKKTAYVFGGVLENKRTAELNQFALDKIYIKTASQLFTSALANPENGVNQKILLEELKKTPVSGRVIAEFDLAMLESYPSLDTLLEDGDSIVIPYVTQQVYIYGEVNNPGTVRYIPGKPAEYYIKNAGGFSYQAEKKQIYAVHPNGVTQSLKAKNPIFNSKIDSAMYPGTVIYIPKEYGIEGTARLKVWAPLVSSLAVTLTSLSVLNNQ